MEIKRFISRYPVLYHMAEVDTWDSIKALGLLSTSAILDLHKVSDRALYETMHRPQMVTIASQNANPIVLRDQIPMPPSRLKVALKGNISPNEWYNFLNRKVFLWATRDRLFRLLGAKGYRLKHHDVLTLDTASFVAEHANEIMLCHLNSGSTYLVPTPRDFSYFKSIQDYETRLNGNPLKEVAEVTVAHKIANVQKYVIKVEKMQGDKVLSVIFDAGK